MPYDMDVSLADAKSVYGTSRAGNRPLFAARARIAIVC